MGFVVDAVGAIEGYANATPLTSSIRRTSRSMDSLRLSGAIRPSMTAVLEARSEVEAPNHSRWPEIVNQGRGNGAPESPVSVVTVE